MMSEPVRKIEAAMLHRLLQYLDSLAGAGTVALMNSIDFYRKYRNKDDVATVLARGAAVAHSAVREPVCGERRAQRKARYQREADAGQAGACRRPAESGQPGSQRQRSW